MNTRNLRKIREKSGLSQKQTAIKLGISQQRYNQYETGKREPDNDTLKRIADYLQTSTDYLLDITENSQNNDKKPVTKSDGMIGLSDEEKEMLKLFRSVPTELQQMTLLALEGHQAVRKEKNEQK